MRIHRFTAFAVAILASGLRPATPECASRPPGVVPKSDGTNVVLIVMDDVGVDQVGCYAAHYEDLTVVPCTPNLNDFANSGVRFTNAWSNPVCSPTRAALLTGRPAGITGIGTVTGAAQPQCVGLDEKLYTAGDFVSNDAAVGKWHLADETQWPTHPRDLGF